VEKFNIPPNTPVIYEVTMLKFERVRKFWFFEQSFISIIGEEGRPNEWWPKTPTIWFIQTTCR
jgi:hypothetical protein